MIEKSPCFIGLSLFFALAATGISREAEAACTVGLTAPGDAAVVTTSPLFRWTGTADCATYRVWLSPSGTFVGDTVMTPWRPLRRHMYDEPTWNGYQGGAWADGVYWRVQSRATDNVLGFSDTTRFVQMDADVDDDTWSLSEGDCDDLDAAVHPGASEVCGDGVDNDCDLVGCRPEGESSLAGATWTGTGGEADQHALAYGGRPRDLNNDGIFDLVVGTSSTTTTDIAAYVVYGPVSGLTDLTLADVVLTQESPSDAGGGSRQIATGDVNGDDMTDLLIGAFLNDSAGTDAGSAYLFYGPLDPDLDLGSADALFTGEAPYDHAGRSVAMSDLNGDGLDEVVVGAPYNDRSGFNAGSVYVFSGAPWGWMDLGDATAILTGEAPFDRAGFAYGGGDYNGDGSEDLVVTSNHNTRGGTDAGAAWVVAGPLAGVSSLSTAFAILVGEEPGDYAGFNATFAGDLNGDGYSDVALTAYNSARGGTRSGAAWVVMGPRAGVIDLSTADAILAGEAAEDRAVYVAAAGDVDLDGMDDLMVGSSQNSRGGVQAGATYLFYGPVSGSGSLGDAPLILTGEAGDYSGYVFSAGDVSGDGIPDLGTSAWWGGTGPSGSGASQVVWTELF